MRPVELVLTIRVKAQIHDNTPADAIADEATAADLRVSNNSQLGGIVMQMTPAFFASVELESAELEEVEAEE